MHEIDYCRSRHREDIGNAVSKEAEEGDMRIKMYMFKGWKLTYGKVFFDESGGSMLLMLWVLFVL